MCYLAIWCCWPNAVGLADVGGLFEVEVMVVDQDLIPYMGQLVLSNVPVKRWIIDPYMHRLLDGSGKGM